MRRNHLATILLVILPVLTLAVRSDAQPVRMPTPVQSPPPGTLPYTTPTAPYPTAPPPTAFPPPAMPATTQPQAVQNLVGDAQRYGLPFDPYAQPAQFVAPPSAVPYTATPPPAAAGPAISWPALPSSWGGFYAGFDGTVLEARTGALSLPGATVSLAGPPPTVQSLNFEPDFDFEFSPRVWAGYKGAAGFGVRGRWWWYDHSGGGAFDIGTLQEGDGVDIDGDLADDDSLTLSLGSDLKFNVIDLEGTQDGEFHNWDFQISGGVRFAEIDYDINGRITGNRDVPPPTDFDGTIAASAEFSGVGPTISFGGRRPFMSVDGLAFLMNLRIAFLFGDSESRITPPTGTVTITGLPESVNFEDSIQAWEAQVGFEYSRQMASGARLFGGAYLEGQIWEWGFPTGITGNDIGFFGPTFTVGIAR